MSELTWSKTPPTELGWYFIKIHAIGGRPVPDKLYPDGPMPALLFLLWGSSYVHTWQARPFSPIKCSDLDADYWPEPIHVPAYTEQEQNYG